MYIYIFILIITDKFIKELNIDNGLIISIIEETIKNKNNFLLPPKTSIVLPNNGFYNTMPCIVDNYYSCKIVIRNTIQNPSISGDIVLYNTQYTQIISHVTSFARPARFLLYQTLL